MTNDPTPMSPEDLANVRLFMRSWRGERDENGYLIDGPDWDTDDMVGAFARLLSAHDHERGRADAAEADAAKEAARALDRIADSGDGGLTEPAE